MTNEKDENGKLLPDEDRLTNFGSILRSSSIDELPALINILKGDMSVIGPRPLPILYKPYFTAKERERHSVRGGLSGLAQINGRNTLSWEEKFAYDLQYIDEISFMLDAKIVLLTLKKVLEHSDIGLRGVTGPIDFNIYRGGQET
jgi:undecaprenyl phosphate N,N'-diacetylbacillosamine 1-phosphate transferase